MIRFLKAAARGVRAEYTLGGGWVPLTGASPWIFGAQNQMPVQP